MHLLLERGGADMHQRPSRCQCALKPKMSQESQEPHQLHLPLWKVQVHMMPMMQNRPMRTWTSEGRKVSAWSFPHAPPTLVPLTSHFEQHVPPSSSNPLEHYVVELQNGSRLHYLQRGVIFMADCAASGHLRSAASLKPVSSLGWIASEQGDQPHTCTPAGRKFCACHRLQPAVCWMRCARGVDMLLWQDGRGSGHHAWP
jgi:hypothetical protein